MKSFYQIPLTWSKTNDLWYIPLKVNHTIWQKQLSKKQINLKSATSPKEISFHFHVCTMQGVYFIIVLWADYLEESAQVNRFQWTPWGAETELTDLIYTLWMKAKVGSGSNAGIIIAVFLAFPLGFCFGVRPSQPVFEFFLESSFFLWKQGYWKWF